jgi:Ca-activated chloride channel homolog
VYDLEPANVPDVLAERPVIIFGKWNGNPTGTIQIKGKTGKEDFNYTFDVSKAEVKTSNRAIKYLWARQKIRMLDDFNNAAGDAKLTEQITGLGLKYNLLTNYTSFIAIDSVVRNKGGKQATVKQPLPLPENVNDYAVGGNAMGVYQSTGNIGSVQCMSIAEKTVSYDAVELKESPAIVEELPAYIGGESAMEAFIEMNLVYPARAKTSGITGTVYVQFTVKADGTIEDVTVLRGIGGGCDEEAVRVIKLMSHKWRPAKQNGAYIETKMNLPIRFDLK